MAIQEAVEVAQHTDINWSNLHRQDGFLQKKLSAKLSNSIMLWFATSRKNVKLTRLMVLEKYSTL